MHAPHLPDTTGRNALAWWYPRIEAAGVPVPRTIVVAMPREAQESIWAAFDGEEGGDMRPFLTALGDACDAIGWPAFLRTDHTAGKHDWSRTCHVPSRDVLPSHVFRLAEESEMADWFGNMRYERWAAREFLPTTPLGICPGYGGMPICREFRFFVDDGKVRCHHPYWPAKALEEGRAEFHDDFDETRFRTLDADELAALTNIVETAGRAVGDSWSIDVLETRRGWFVTDMAVAGESFHWVGCRHAHDAPNPQEEPVPFDASSLLVDAPPA